MHSVVLPGAAGNLGVNAFFIRQMTYDPLHELAPVTLAVSGGNVLVRASVGSRRIGAGRLRALAVTTAQRSTWHPPRFHSKYRRKPVLLKE